MQGKKAAQSKIAAVLNSLKTGMVFRARLPEAKNQVGHAHDKQRNSPKKTINRQKDQGTKTAKNNRKNQMKRKAILCFEISCLLEFVAVS